MPWAGRTSRAPKAYYIAVTRCRLPQLGIMMQASPPARCVSARVRTPLRHDSIAAKTLVRGGAGSQGERLGRPLVSNLSSPRRRRVVES